ncbi:MAG: helix-turn-helix transcriptional regulator [Dysgonamonadaceae bacterium]|jgi:AraC-like DNA-binding protein|nr:helix-turn-helix transcriptional regulator [Dysgonamonadaceae bacterium]
MKLTTRFFIQGLLCLFICFISATAIYGQNNDFQHKKDSLLKIIASTQGKEKLATYKQLTNSNFHFPEEEINIKLQYIKDFIREARKQQNKKYENDAYRAELACLWNNLMFDKFEQEAKRYLPFFKENGYSENYYDIYACMIIRQYGNDNSKGLTEGTKEMYAEAKQEDNLYGMSKATYLLAEMYFVEERFDDAEKYYNETIKNVLLLIKNAPDKSDNYDLVSFGYYGLALALTHQKKTNELLLLMPVWEQHIIAFEKAFCYSERQKRYYYKIKAKICLYKKEYEKAELYCDSIDAITPSVELFLSWDLRADICEAREEYDKAIDWIDKIISFNSNIEETISMVHLLRLKSEYLSKMGRAEESYSFSEMAFQYNDSLRTLKTNAQLDEIRTQYEVDKHVAKEERQRIIIFSLISGCIVLLLALGIWIHYSRKITQKNRILAHQIRELTIQQEGQINEMLTKTSFVPEEEKPETVDSDLCVESRMDKLCIAIRDLLLKEKIYRNPAITQDLVIEQLRTSRRLFSEAFEYCFNMKFNDYINSLRLKDAVVLLEQSDLSIEEISDKVGFGAARTFRRQFSEKYGISPKNYRDENVTRIS